MQKQNIFQRNAARASVAVGTLTAAGLSQAAVDTTDVVAAITAAGAAIAVVGAAYLVMRIGGRVYKWIASAI